jgi:hypothetical protein
MQQDSTSSKPPRQLSSLACTACRRRHLKCDAQTPVCSRCQASNTECRYIQSRRGLRTKNGNLPQELLDDNVSLFSGIDPDAFPDWLSGMTLPSDLVDVWTFLRRLRYGEESLTEPDRSSTLPTTTRCSPDDRHLRSARDCTCVARTREHRNTRSCI